MLNKKGLDFRNKNPNPSRSGAPSQPHLLLTIEIVKSKRVVEQGSRILMYDFSAANLTRQNKSVKSFNAAVATLCQGDRFSEDNALSIRNAQAHPDGQAQWPKTKKFRARWWWSHPYHYFAGWSLFRVSYPQTGAYFHQRTHTEMRWSK